MYLLRLFLLSARELGFDHVLGKVSIWHLATHHEHEYEHAKFQTSSNIIFYGMATTTDRPLASLARAPVWIEINCLTHSNTFIRGSRGLAAQPTGSARGKRTPIQIAID